MGYTLLSILIAIFGFSLQNISQATQKIGLLTMPRNRTKGIIIWSIATIGTGTSAVVLLFAISFGQVSLVGAMAGTGLVALTIYARLTLKEKVGRKEIFGIILIIIAAFLIGFFAQENKNTLIVVHFLIAKLFIVTGTYFLLWFIFRKKNSVLAVVLGGFAGATGGFVSQFQKLSTASKESGILLSQTSSPLNDPLELINRYTLIWILLSICSMVILQFAHRTGRTLRVIPAFAANVILIPLLGGVTCFGETLKLVQWFGVILILTGVLFITIKGEKSPFISSNTF